MGGLRCDALVLFGVSGHLAAKMLLPAVDALARCGDLDVPLIGVALLSPGERWHDPVQSR